MFAMLSSIALAGLVGSPFGAPRSDQGLLYVARPGGVTVYAQSNLQQVSQLSYGIDDPQGVAVDAAGNAYVSNPYLALFFQSYNDVAVFPPGTTSPSFTYTDGLVNPQASALAPDGTLYELDTYNRCITVFPHGGASFSRMEFPVHGQPTSLALDGGGTLFVGYEDLPYDGTLHVAEFAPGSRTPTVLGLSFSSLQALAFDANGNLLAADARAGTISVFPPGATQPSRVLKGFTQGIFSFTLSAAGDRLFVANGYEVDEVTYPGGKAVAKIPSQSINVFSVAASPALAPGQYAALRQPQRVEVEAPAPKPAVPARPARGWMSPDIRSLASSGLLYVAVADNTIDVYPRNQSRKLVGQITQGVSDPTALTTDAANNLYVASGSGNTVSVYPPGATQPGTTYSTGIRGPNGLAVDTRGTLYVSNGGGQTITEYAAGSMTPTTTISGVYTIGLGVDAARNLYDLVGGASGSDATASVYKYAPGSTSGVFTGIELASTLQGAAGLAVSSDATVAVLFGNVTCFPHASGNGPSFSLGNAVSAAFTRSGKRIYAIDATFGTADEFIYPDGNHNNAIELNSPVAIAVTGD